jgi:hypothetical protein
VIADALAEGYGRAKDEDVERVAARTTTPAAAGPRSTAAPARVEESETPSAEDAAKIAASTVFEPDAPEAPAAEGPETSEVSESPEGVGESENPEAAGSAEPFEGGSGEETREPHGAPEGASGAPDGVVVAEPVEAVAAAVPDGPEEPA